MQIIPIQLRRVIMIDVMIVVTCVTMMIKGANQHKFRCFFFFEVEVSIFMCYGCQIESLVLVCGTDSMYFKDSAPVNNQ